MYLSTKELIALAMEQNNLAKEYVIEKQSNNKLIIVVVIIMLILLWTSLTAASDKHTSLYMDVTVKSVVSVVDIDGAPAGYISYNVEFVNNVGDIFRFTDVTKPFKYGERTTIEVVVDFKRGVDGVELFEVVDMFYVVQNTRFIYPSNNPEEWKMFVGLGVIILAVLFGGFLLGRINNNKPRPNRRITTI